MAAPISSYDLLKPLSEPYSSYLELYRMKEALKGFNLFAFIIHDPERHSDFDQKMGRIFDRLDYLTGEKLLFFTLIDPPEEWLKHGGQREYMKHLGYGKALALPNPNNTITSTDKELTAFSLAKSLNIPIDMLPCIVITRNFCISDFVWVRTCENHVMKQLEDLGYMARRAMEGVDLPAEEDMIQQIDLCEGSGSESLEVNLARALTDAIIFMRNDPEIRQQVEETIDNLNRTLREKKETIDNLKRTLKKKKARTNSEQDEQSIKSLDSEIKSLDSDLDSFCEKIVSCFAHLNTQPSSSSADFIHIDMDHLELDSRLMLKTAHMVNDLLRNVPDQRVEYSPVAICLAKVFEKEINLSVVHWIRQQKNVILPRFFNRYQPDIDDTIVTANWGGRDFTIDVNKPARGGKRWHPPTIGDSLHAYRQLRQNMIHWFNPPEDFDNDWDKIRMLRNDAAHPQFLVPNSVNIIQQIFNKLAEEGIFEQLHKMKRAGRQTGFELNP